MITCLPRRRALMADQGLRVLIIITARIRAPEILLEAPAKTIRRTPRAFLHLRVLAMAPPRAYFPGFFLPRTAGATRTKQISDWGTHPPSGADHLQEPVPLNPLWMRERFLVKHRRMDGWRSTSTPGDLSGLSRFLPTC